MSGQNIILNSSVAMKVPADLVEQWRLLMTVVARSLKVAVGLVTCVRGPNQIEMTAPGYGAETVYPVGSHFDLEPGLYCERVVSGDAELLISDATATPEWQCSPDAELGLVAYLGLPVHWPDGRVFGTICVLNGSPRDFNQTDRALLMSAREAVEDSLAQHAAISSVRTRSPTANLPRISFGTWDLNVPTGRLRLSDSVASQFPPLNDSDEAPEQVEDWVSRLATCDRNRLQSMLDDLISGRRRLGSVALFRHGSQKTITRILAHSVADARGNVLMLAGLHVAVSAERLLGKLDDMRRSVRAPEIAELRISSSGKIESISRPFRDLLKARGIMPGADFAALAKNLQDADELAAALKSFRSSKDLTPGIVVPVKLSTRDIPVFVAITWGLGDDVLVSIVPQELEFDLPEVFAPSNRDNVTGLPTRSVLVGRMARPDVATKRVLCVVEVLNMGSLIEHEGYAAAEKLLARLANSLQAPDRFAASLGFGHLAFLAEADCGEQLAEQTHGELQAVAENWGAAIDVAVGVVDAPVCDAAGARDILTTAIETVRAMPRLGGGAKYGAGRHRDAVHHNWHELIRNFDSSTARTLRLAHQPIVSVRPGVRSSRGEILLRLAKPDGTVTSAAGLVIAAEASKAIEKVDRWVFEAVLSYLEAHDAPWVASVNVSARTIMTSASWRRYLQPLERINKVDPSRLMFEITETSAARDPTSTKSFVDTVRSWGAGVAIDDFGTGSNSLVMLQSMRVDEIKIDQSFVRGAPSGGMAASIVEGIVHIARSVGCDTVAEGVADNTIQEAVTSLGVDFVQGYHVGRPTLIEQHARVPA